jgi:light-harvesting complex II chlorophyll a/b binding protein 4
MLFSSASSSAATAVATLRAEAGKVELDGATYAGFDLPFSITQLVWIEAILVGGAEIYRNTELDPERRLYPGELRFPAPRWLPPLICCPFGA